MGVELPVGPVIDAEADLLESDDGCIVRARLNVSLPRVDRAIAQSLLGSAHETCPYAKAIGNTDTEVNLV